MEAINQDTRHISSRPVGEPPAAAGRFLIWVERGTEIRDPFVLEEGETIVGRTSAAHLSVADPYVSRQHLKITRHGDEVTVACLSRYGAAVDGQVIKVPTVIKSGQRISLSADTTLRFEVEQVEPVEDQELTRAGTAAGAPPAVTDSATPPAVPGPETAPAATGARSTSAGVRAPEKAPAPSAPKVRKSKPHLGAFFARFESQLIALVVTVAILLAVKLLMPSTSYTYQFLLKRSACQWVSLYAFMFGIACLLRRWGHWLKDRSMLDLLRVGRAEATGSGTVWKRFHRIQYYTTRIDPPELRTLAKELAEHDADDLRTAYAPVSDVIQILPLIGFLGNVLGLSLGLNASFSKAGAGTSFIASIGTAFDTTLLALACTIALMVLQRLVHRQEETLLGNLNEYVETYVEDRLPEKDAEKALPDTDAGRMLAELRSALDGLCQQVGAKMSETIASHGQAALESMQSQMSNIRTSMQDVQAALAQSVTGIGDGMKEQALQVSETLGVAARTALTATFTELKAEFVATCARHVQGEQDQAPRLAAAVGEAVAPLRQDLQRLQSALVEAGRENSRAYLQSCAAMDEHLQGLREQIVALHPAAAADRELIVQALRENVLELCRHMEKVLKQPRRVSIVDVAESDQPGLGA